MVKFIIADKMGIKNLTLQLITNQREDYFHKERIFSLNQNKKVIKMISF